MTMDACGRLSGVWHLAGVRSARECRERRELSLDALGGWVPGSLQRTGLARTAGLHSAGDGFAMDSAGDLSSHGEDPQFDRGVQLRRSAKQALTACTEGGRSQRAVLAHLACAFMAACGILLVLAHGAGLAFATAIQQLVCRFSLLCELFRVISGLFEGY